MALQINYDSAQYGVNSSVAYAKIEKFSGNINEVTFGVFIYATVTARQEGKNPIGYFDFTIPYSDGMTYSNVYAYFKTLPGFENAIDV